MKILVVTDAVDQAVYSAAIKQRFADVELVLGCGDLPPYYLEFIVTMLDVPVYYVRGNHDHELMAPDGDGQLRPPGGCTSIDGHVVTHNGLVIAGLGGSRRYNDKADQYSDFEMRWRMLRLEPALLRRRQQRGRGCDILVTHAPPRGINDQEDICHQGFPTFLTFLDRYRPRYMVHGHIHLYNRNAPYRATYGQTEIINAFPFRVLDVPVEGARAEPAAAASRD
ncbi:MAG: metallophosphoesterase [Chloroflexi bacterium]|nr:metallophosphoesterase [Chloroflexota bacterium]